MTTRIKRSIFVISLTIFLFSAVTTAEVVDRIVAVVNDDIILLSELGKAVAPYLEKINTAGYGEEKKAKLTYKLRQDMLNRMIDRKLTDQEVERHGITVSDKELDAAIERFKSAQLMTQEKLEAALESEGMTFREYRENMRQEIMRPKLINYSIKSKVIVTDGEVEAYYNEHKADYAGEKKFHLYNILVKPDAYALDDKRDSARRIIEKVKELLDSGEDFKELARQYSQAPNSVDMGDLGFFSQDSFSPQLKDAVLGLGVGSFTDVIDMTQGYQIFFLEAVEETPGKSLEEVSDEINTKLYNSVVEKKFKVWLESLRDRSHIKLML